MKEHTIEIDGVPEGFEVHDIKLNLSHLQCLELNPDCSKYNPLIKNVMCNATVILQKTKPRRIVLEETAEVRQPRLGEWFIYDGKLKQKPNDHPLCSDFRIWKEIKE